MSEKVNIINRRASYEYHFLDVYEAGIQLTGTEIKSIRQGKVNFGDAFCIFINGELFVKNMHIAEYTSGSYYNHDPVRMRKLLLHRSELRKLNGKSSEKGLTIVPRKLFINDKGFAKLEIVLAQGKKTYDKRQDIKSRDVKRKLRQNTDD